MTPEIEVCLVFIAVFLVGFFIGRGSMWNKLAKTTKEMADQYEKESREWKLWAKTAMEDYD